MSDGNIKNIKKDTKKYNEKNNKRKQKGKSKKKRNDKNELLIDKNTNRRKLKTKKRRLKKKKEMNMTILNGGAISDIEKKLGIKSKELLADKIEKYSKLYEESSNEFISSMKSLNMYTTSKVVKHIVRILELIYSNKIDSSTITNQSSLEDNRLEIINSRNNYNARLYGIIPKEIIIIKNPGKKNESKKLVDINKKRKERKSWIDKYNRNPLSFNSCDNKQKISQYRIECYVKSMREKEMRYNKMYYVLNNLIKRFRALFSKEYLRQIKILSESSELDERLGNKEKEELKLLRKYKDEIETIHSRLSEIDKNARKIRKDIRGEIKSYFPYYGFERYEKFTGEALLALNKEMKEQYLRKYNQTSENLKNNVRKLSFELMNNYFNIINDKSLLMDMKKKFIDGDNSDNLIDEIRLLDSKINNNINKIKSNILKQSSKKTVVKSKTIKGKIYERLIGLIDISVESSDRLVRRDIGTLTLINFIKTKTSGKGRKSYDNVSEYKFYKTHNLVEKLINPYMDSRNVKLSERFVDVNKLIFTKRDLGIELNIGTQNDNDLKNIYGDDDDDLNSEINSYDDLNTKSSSISYYPLTENNYYAMLNTDIIFPNDIIWGTAIYLYKIKTNLNEYLNAMNSGDSDFSSIKKQIRHIYKIGTRKSWLFGKSKSKFVDDDPKFKKDKFNDKLVESKVDNMAFVSVMELILYIYNVNIDIFITFTQIIESLSEYDKYYNIHKKTNKNIIRRDITLSEINDITSKIGIKSAVGQGIISSSIVRESSILGNLTLGDIFSSIDVSLAVNIIYPDDNDDNNLKLKQKLSDILNSLDDKMIEIFNSYSNQMINGVKNENDKDDENENDKDDDGDNNDGDDNGYTEDNSDNIDSNN